jgi:hypothetical protein
METHDPRRPHIADVSVGHPLRLEPTTNLAEGFLGGCQEGEVVETSSLKHRAARRGRSGSAQELERMQNGGPAHLYESVPYALLRHVERHPSVECPLVERRETVEIVRQERNVVHCLEKPHPRWFYGTLAAPASAGRNLGRM